MPRVRRTTRAGRAPAASTELRFHAGLSDGSRQKLAVLESAMMARRMWSDALGQQAGGDRDVYVSAGWKKQPEFADFLRRFQRQDIAQTLVSAYPDATWREEPMVREDDKDEDTPFEKAFKEHAEKVRLWHYLRRVDIMSGVGKYAVLLLGLKDGKKLETKAASASELIYLQPYYEGSATIQGWNRDSTSPQYGWPSGYKITSRVGVVTEGESNTGDAVVVDASRVLHVAEGCLESDVFGVSRLQRVYNRLEDLEKMLAASAEGYWKRAFPMSAFVKDPDASWDDSESDMEDEIEDAYNGLTRWMRLSGMQIHEFKAEIASPKDHWEFQLAMLACASRIPVRILTGSERGELASSQDESAWLSRVDERRKNFAWPMILRPYIERMVALGVLPQPKEMWCAWPDINALSEKDQAEVAGKRSAALRDYASGLANGIDLVMPPYYFLADVMGIDEDRIQEYEKVVEELEAEQKAEEEEAAAVAAEEAGAQPSAPPKPLPGVQDGDATKPKPKPKLRAQ